MTFCKYKTLHLFRRVFLLILFFFPFQEEQVACFAQSVYDTDLLPKEFHSGRRDALRKIMPDSSVAVFFSFPVRNRSNDIDYEFHQEPNFYYLSGLREPNAVLFVFKDEYQSNDFSVNEILFLSDKNSQSKQWTNKRLGTWGAEKTLGIQKALSIDTFSEIKIDFSKFKNILLIRNDEIKESSLYKQFKLKLSIAHTSADIYLLSEMMATLRERKTKEEILLLRKAIESTCDALKEAMKMVEPGMYEYEIKSGIEYIFKSKGAEHSAFPSIVGGGENSCILHYETSRKKIIAKDIIVCDVGAEYHGYCADVTRTIPADGKFSEQEKILYSIVLEAQNTGIALCKAGNDFRAPHKAAIAMLQKRLFEVGIIKTPNEVNNFFFHGTSHYIGLDVHDVGLYGKLKPGNVITIEPGIYIPWGSDCDEKWWNIGIRIEDDILITETEPEVISSCVPKSISEIEELMKKESLFNLMKK
ncbi:MAG: aminopeptidase P N-terminal domain-containing protein [Bacteroidota bacterium]